MVEVTKEDLKAACSALILELEDENLKFSNRSNGAEDIDGNFVATNSAVAAKYSLESLVDLVTKNWNEEDVIRRMIAYQSKLIFGYATLQAVAVSFSREAMLLLAKETMKIIEGYDDGELIESSYSPTCEYGYA